MDDKNPFQNRVTKTKKLGKEAMLKISVNDITRLIFVDFSSVDGKLVVQKTFRNNFEGKKQAKEFENRFKNLNDLKKYFGMV